MKMSSKCFAIYHVFFHEINLSQVNICEITGVYQLLGIVKRKAEFTAMHKTRNRGGSARKAVATFRSSR